MKNLEPELAEVEKFFTHLAQETDRGAALSAGAMLDDRLGDVLRGFLVKSKEVKLLFNGMNAPFGSL